MENKNKSEEFTLVPKEAHWCNTSTTPMTYNEVDLTFNISIKRAKFVGFVQ